MAPLPKGGFACFQYSIYRGIMQYCLLSIIITPQDAKNRTAKQKILRIKKLFAILKLSESPPCLKGGWASDSEVRGDTVERKHNVELTKRAKELRKNMTDEERRLWYDFLRSYPVRFLRQKVIDNYIVDFYCHQARLIIEIDGSQHYQEKGLVYDRIRTEKIESRNLTVIRIPNNEIKQNFRGVCEYIDLFIQNSMRSE